MNKTEIVNSLYKSYGTDSGILLGISDRQVVEAIVEYTLSRSQSLPSGEGPVSEAAEIIKAFKEIEGYAYKINEHTWQTYSDQILLVVGRELDALAGFSHAQPREDRSVYWIFVQDDLPPECTVVLGYSRKWIDPDFEPEGIRECFFNDGDWTSAKWNNYQDCWDSDSGTKPTHWMRRPLNPHSLIKQTHAQSQGQEEEWLIKAQEEKNEERI